MSADPTISGASAAVPAAAADAAAAVEAGNGASGDGDVYMAGGGGEAGVWEAENRLDAEYDASGETSAYEPHTMSIEVSSPADESQNNTPGKWVIL